MPAHWSCAQTIKRILSCIAIVASHKGTLVRDSLGVTSTGRVPLLLSLPHTGITSEHPFSHILVSSLRDVLTGERLAGLLGLLQIVPRRFHAVEPDAFLVNEFYAASDASTV